MATMKSNMFLSTSHLPNDWEQIANQINKEFASGLDGTKEWTRDSKKSSFTPKTHVPADAECSIWNQLAANTCTALQDCSAEDPTAQTACLNMVKDLHDAVKYDFRTSDPTTAKTDRLKLLTDFAKLKGEIKQMNPAIAYNILSGFGFAYYKDVPKSGPSAGIVQYKVQPATDWLKEVRSGKKAPSCMWKLGSTPVSACPPLKERISPDLYKKLTELTTGANASEKQQNEVTLLNLASYLDILSSWVNANPSVLNKEFVSNPTFSTPADTKDPVANDFKIYNWRPDDRTLTLQNFNETMCGFDRLRAGVTGQGFNTGISGNFLASSILTTPGSLSMPFTRSLTNPFGTPFFGGNGGISSAVQALQALDLSQYYKSHETFSEIYKSVLDSIKTFGDGAKLSETSRKEIESKIDSLKKEEEGLVQAMKDFYEKVQVYQKSKGHIDPFSLEPSEWEDLQKKHANLIRKTNIVNNRAVQLIDIIQALNKVVVDRLGSSIGQPKYQGMAFT